MAADLKSLARFYKRYFKTHTVFQQPEKKVVAYLHKAVKEHTFIAVHDGRKIAGALFIVLEGKDGTHSRWKLRHLAFIHHDVGHVLLEVAEQQVRQKSVTGKIELTLAEDEPHRQFLVKRGYKKEGVLKNHYRWNEKCYVLGKSVHK